MAFKTFTNGIIRGERFAGVHEVPKKALGWECEESRDERREAMKNMSRRNFLKAAGIASASTLGLAACGGTGDKSDKIKIGISIWSSTDVLGSASVDIIKRAAEALGDVEISNVVDQGHVSEQVTGSVETLCAAGCDGIVICNSADSEMIPAIMTCDQYEVYIAQFYRMINEERSPFVYEVAKKSKYFVGSVHEDEVKNGETLVELLAQDRTDVPEGIAKGARNIKLEGWTAGDATFQQRWEGYKSGVEKWNSENPSDKIELSEPVYATTAAAKAAEVTQAFYNQDSDMDALIVAGGGGDPLAGSLKALENMNLTGKIRVVSTDFRDDLEDQLASGGIYAESGGHFCDPLYSFLLVYNACKGKFKPQEGDYGCEILFPYVYVSSVDEYKDYEKYFVETPPYNDEELRTLAGLDIDDLKQWAEKLSIEEVKERHDGTGAAGTATKAASKAAKKTAARKAARKKAARKKAAAKKARK